MSKFSNERLIEIAKLFLRLGIIGFGGPAAHIALMEDEVVNRRGWLERGQFLDLIGATNLIPGPNSTEMAIHVGYLYGGLPGLFLAGFCFILPAVSITAILARIYTQYGSLPEIAPILAGIKPVVIAIIIGALYRLGKKAIYKQEQTQIFLAIATGVIILLFLGINQVIALLAGGLLGATLLLITGKNRDLGNGSIGMFIGGLSISSTIKTASVASSTILTPSLWELGLFFLKVGSILFGSGYVLVAFLQGELVDKYNWLTQQQLLDAIAIGQFTPGPVLSTSTFIGYIILGIPGAIVATIGIFLPSFCFVFAFNPLIPKMRQSKYASAFLDAVNASALALMVFVTLRLAQSTFIEPSFQIIDVAIAVVAAVLVIRFKVNPAWLVLGGAMVGWILSSLL
ncbi:MAG: chromate efflux transporter [Xenococcaceae cyanobacterium MO_188.B29]|nr:chromate efflux transporter [Xenococcaceae cyanobacterium MO_188.B29]